MSERKGLILYPKYMSKLCHWDPKKIKISYYRTTLTNQTSSAELIVLRTKKQIKIKDDD